MAFTRPVGDHHPRVRRGAFLAAAATLGLVSCGGSGDATSPGQVGNTTLTSLVTVDSAFDVPAETTATGAGTADVSSTGSDPTGSNPASAGTNLFAGDDSWIAFQRVSSDDEVQVWLVHPDGTDEHQILNGVDDDVRYPAWSPDGQRLVVASLGGPVEHLYEYDLATDTSRVPISCEACAADEPTYSPDGDNLLFVLYDGGLVFSEDAGGEVPADCGIATADLVTGEVVRLTSNTEPPCDREYGPRWSPDGSRIVYTRDPYESGRPTGTSVHVMEADGTGERQLTDPSLPMGDAAWSPDGAWIVFSSYPLFEYGEAPGPSNLYRIRPDGSGLEQLTFNEAGDPRATLPSYSPDGAWIVFTSVTGTGRDLAAIPSGGGEPIVLAVGTAGRNFTAPAWQP